MGKEHWEWRTKILLGNYDSEWENWPWRTSIVCITIVVSKGSLGPKEWFDKTWRWQLLLIFLLWLKMKTEKCLMQIL